MEANRVKNLQFLYNWNCHMWMVFFTTEITSVSKYHSLDRRKKHRFCLCSVALWRTQMTRMETQLQCLSALEMFQHIHHNFTRNEVWSCKIRKALSLAGNSQGRQLFGFVASQPSHVTSKLPCQCFHITCFPSGFHWLCNTIPVLYYTSYLIKLHW